MPWAVSIGLHAVPLAHALGRPAPRPSPPSLEPMETPAVLPGETFDIDAFSLPTFSPAASQPPDEPAEALVVVVPAAKGRASEEPALADAPEPSKPPGEADAPAPRSRTAAALAPAQSAATKASGNYGQEQALAHAAPLSKGLLRVLPRVAYPEAAFHTVPLGATARTRFSIDLDEDGRVVQAPRFDQHRPRDLWLDDIVVRACLLLRGGAFGLSAGKAGTHAFSLEVEVVQVAPREGDWLEPRDLAEIGRLVEPTLLAPGRAHFIYNSGRQVRLTLSLGSR